VTVKLDKTKPSIAGTIVSGIEGSNGWYLGTVTVHFTCSDDLSKIATCPDNVTLSAEGANSASGTATDNAGNASSTTVSGIKIDGTPPSTSIAVEGTDVGAWFAGQAQVTLHATDTVSGVDKTYYSVDGSAAKEYGAAFSFATQGEHVITYWSADLAGNVELAGANSETIKIDGIAPTTTMVKPVTPFGGWFATSSIPIEFTASDPGSGVKGTYYSIDGGATTEYGALATVELSIGVHTVTYWSADVTGNTEAKQMGTVRVDTVMPSISSGATPAANAFGWNKTSVVVAFTCSDADSRIAGCDPDMTLPNEGAGQQAVGNAVDNAGNKASVAVGPINIDKTAPNLTGAATTDPNGAGWYNGDVRVAWTAADGLSGIETSARPANSLITGEGDNLGSSASVSDRAGNLANASVSGIRIDRTAPVVAGAATTLPNTAGWYSGQVTVDFTCTDNLSGIAYCPTSKVIAGNGANQSTTSAPVSDVAGNDGIGKTVGEINIDGAAPVSSANNLCTKVNGYCTGTTANVVLTAVDQVGLSGVKELHYKIDGGAEQVTAGSNKTVSVPLDGSGAGTVAYWAVDVAGNAETPNSVSLRWDNIAPTVKHTVSPEPNASEWNRSDVTVTFTAKDDDAGSLVESVTAPQTVSTETDGLVVKGSATDTAGNVGTDSVTIKLDKTPPTITGTILPGTTSTSGWYGGAVTVHFTCTDSLSGVASCPGNVILSANGANSAVGTATDNAGNSTSTTVSGIYIDQERPTISNVSVAGGFYVLGAIPAATCTSTDSFSGPAGCTVTVTGGTPNGVGTFSYTATATDKAGNKTTTTGTYRVVYRFDGFLQPINDTAHQVGLSTSIFKAGSTVPVKFELKKANGTLVQANTAPAWLTPLKGGAMTMQVDESVYTASTDSGSDYRSDGSQYIYNWKTGTGGYFYRIGVTLDDGQNYYVSIGLR